MESVSEAEFLGFAREYFRGHPEMREVFREREAVAFLREHKESDSLRGALCEAVRQGEPEAAGRQT